MYAVILLNQIAYAMHRSELSTLNLRGTEAVLFYNSLEEAVDVSNQLNSYVKSLK